MSAGSISEAFMLTVELATLSGASKINELPGCWEYTIGGQWRISFNGHKETIQCSKGRKVPAHSIALEYIPTGFPAAILCINEGIFMSGSEDDFIAAVKDEIGRLTNGSN